MISRALLLMAITGATPPDTLYLTITEAEARFLQKNLLLYAQKLRIDAERALLLQARLWPNPNFSIEQMDFFAPYDPDVHPLSEVPRFYQIAANFSQTILTAGKRTYNIALQNAAIHIQEAVFGDLLRQLRYDLHTRLRALQRDQIIQATLARQESLLTSLVHRYQALAQSGIVSETDYLRLHSLLQSVRTTLRERHLLHEENANSVRQLLNLPIREQILWIDTADFWPTQDTLMPPLDSLLSLAPNRPDVRLAAYQLSREEANLRLQKAYVYPDLNLLLNYDRLGAYRTNQIGFGLGLTLPLWNRNQGNIQAARSLLQASQVLYENALSTAQSEILAAWRTLTFLKKQWSQTNLALLPTYQNAEARYYQALQNQRISLLDYISFFQGYQDFLLNLTQLAYDYHQAQAKMQRVTATLP